MKKTITYCDSCGKDTKSDYFYSARVDFIVKRDGGGSYGGPSENTFIQDADLCKDCAKKLQHFLAHELNIKPHHP